MNFEQLMNNAVATSISSAKSYDKARIVQQVPPQHINTILQNLSHETKSAELLAAENKKIITGLGKDTDNLPNPLPVKIYIAGALGCNDQLFDNEAAMPPEAKRLIAEKTAGHDVCRYSFTNITAGISSYDRNNHELSFPM